jgi:hypothetical protein
VGFLEFRIIHTTLGLLSDQSAPFAPFRSYQMTALSFSEDEKENFRYVPKSQEPIAILDLDPRDNMTPSYTSNDCPAFRWTPHRLF